MNDIIKIIILLIIGTATLGAFMLLIEWGTERQEQYECQKWQVEAKEYADKGYFLADWQKAQCQHYGIEINAN
jgi:hypothetical protein